MLYNLSRILLLSLLLLGSHWAQAQVLVHYWNFNNSATETDLLTPSQGNGSIQHLQGGSSVIQTTSNINQGFEVTNPNARNNDVSGTHLRFNTPIGGQLEFGLPTSGYQQVVVKYATRRSGSGAGVQYIHYSTDGSSYQLFDSIFPVDGNPTMQSLDFSALAAVNNNPNFKIRISFAAGPGGTGGNNRFDNFTLEGNNLPSLVHYWNFNDATSESSLLSPNVGAGSIQHLQGGSSTIQITSNINQGFEVTNPNARNGDLSGTHLRFNTPIGGMLEFNLPTSGAEQVVVRYATRRSGSGAGVQYIHYSTDGTNFQLFDSIFPVDGDPSLQTLDFSQLSAVENNANFKIRISFAAGPGGTGGNNRFDNFTLEGVTAGGNVDTFPPLARFVPVSGSTQQSISLQPLVIFSESMQLPSQQGLTAAAADTVLQFFTTNSSQAVAFSTQLSGDTLRVIPAAPLQSNTSYTLAIRDGLLTDLAGNALAAGQSTTFSTLPTQTQFQAGDWLPVAYRMNATGTPDGVAFLTMVDILPGTVVYLADAKYTDNTPAQCPGGITWTAPASGVARGTVIEIGTDAGTANIGSITGNTFGLSSGGDQVMVYTGSNTQPNYLMALSANAWLANNTSCSGSFSKLPTGLVDGVTALNLSTAPGNDNGLSVNAYYNGPQSGPGYRDSILNTAYWVVSGAGTPAQQWPNWGFPGPPAVASARVLSNTSIEIAFTQDMLLASLLDTNNYSGIAGLSNINVSSNGSLADTVVLTYSQPFASGATYTLQIANVQNTDSLTMGLPFNFSFTYNTSLGFAGRYLVVEENAGTVSLPFELDFPGQASFFLRLRSQTTADGQDHGLVSQTVQITGSSQANQLVSFSINADGLVEDDEYLIVEVDSLQGVQWQGPTYFTVYIRDNDRALPQQDSAVQMTLVTSFDPSATGSTTEVVAYDKVNRRLYATSAIENRFDIINFTDPANPVTISSVSMNPYGGLTSIAVKPGLVAVASPNNNEQLPGTVVFFDPQGNFISQVTVGALPDMVVFSPDGNRLLVANEGQPNTDFSVDPEGSISIINTSGASISQADVTTVDFTSFNAQEATLVAAGVRKGSNIGTLSQNLEPEYITVADDNSKAWVTLQENNSIAEINLLNNTITQLWGMGLKDNSVAGNGFDASDNIPEALLVAWPTKMYYMPDAMGQFSIGGNTYLVTANEGDEREYSALNERTSVGASSTVLDSMQFPHADMLKENHAIGRLRITNQNGDYDNDGDFDDVINVGSRSMSIWNAQTGAQVWDSKNQIELITLLDPIYGSLFNSDHEENVRKGRSRSKGPEPEGLAMAQVGNRHFAFVGMERVGGIIAYEVTDPTMPVFNGYLNARNPSSLGGDLGPETMVYIPADDSPDGQAYLVVANEISGSLSIIRLQFNVPQAAPNYTLQILHASDMEGGLDAPKDAPGFAAVIDQLEEAYTNTLILSSGDNFIPSPFLSAGEDPSITAPLRAAASLFFPGQQAVRAAIGRPDIAILNLIGFNASVFGNHEFDLGTGELNSMIGVDIRSGGADKRWVGAQFPYLSANLDFSADPNLAYLVTADGQPDTAFRTPANITANNQKKGIARSVVIERGGEKIGIVGATTQVLASISSPGNTTVVGPSVNDMPALAAVLQPVIDSLRLGQGINKIIVLSHLQQLSLEQALAPLLTGVDVIVAGGSHSLLADSNDILRPGDVAVGTYPIVSQGADNQPLLIVNTQSEYRYLGRLVLEFDTNGVILTQALDPLINGAYATDSVGVARVWGNHAAAFAAGTKGANVKALTDVMQTVIVAKDGNIFGKASVFLEGRREFTRTEETNLGNLTADANLWQARQADPTVALSLKNGGGIRQAMGTVNAVGSSVTLEPTAPNPAAGKQQGDISQLDIENSMRFNNRLSVLTIPVTGIKEMLEHGVAQTAPGVTPGRFPQVGGMAFSFDPSQPVNSRIQSLVRIDSAGNIIDTLVRNGQIHGDPTRTYKLVTLNFLAGGGDGYPFPQYAATRVDLDTVLTAAGAATFTVPGSEQDAFAEYMVQRYPASSPYAIAETAAALDFRIQDLSRRNDSLLPFDLATLLAPANNSRLATNPGNSMPVQIRWSAARNAQSYKWSITTATGNFAPGLANLLSDNNGADTTLSLTVGAIDNLLASLGVAAGDSIETRWTVKSFYNNGADSTLAAPFALRLVRLALPQPFNLLNPANNARVVSIPNDNTPVTINWTSSVNAATYRWVAALATGNLNSPLVTLTANNAGADTALSLTLGSIDALLASLGVNQGDSVDLVWSVRAINAAGTDSALASSPRNIRLVRQQLQLGSFSLLTPANNTRILTQPLNNSLLPITWQASSNATSYEWLVDVAGGDFSAPILNLPAQNGGSDTSLILLNRSVDSLLQLFNVLPGDSSSLIWTVRASSGSVSRLANAPFTINLVRDAQISSFNLLSPADNGRVEVRGPASTPVTISWQAATSPAAAPLRYRWLADPAGNFSNPFLSLPADMSGAATQLTLTTGAIDTLLAGAGVAIGDSISLQWTVRATTGVSSRDAASTFTVRLIRVGLTSSVAPLSKISLQVYPNPSHDKVTIRTSGEQIQQLRVYSLTGAEVLVLAPAANAVEIDLTTWPVGTYLIRVQTPQGMANRRLVVTR